MLQILQLIVVDNSKNFEKEILLIVYETTTLSRIFAVLNVFIVLR